MSAKYDNSVNYGIATVSDICRIRKDMEIGCHSCVYYGQRCDKYKQKYSVDRPSEIKEDNDYVNYKSQQNNE